MSRREEKSIEVVFIAIELVMLERRVSTERFTVQFYFEGISADSGCG